MKPGKLHLSTLAMWAFIILQTSGTAFAASYYLDADRGSDDNNGLAATSAWQSLRRAGRERYRPGDHICLKRGQVFPGMLQLSAVHGRRRKPVVVEAYGAKDDGRPLIRADAEPAGIMVKASSNIVIRDLAISADGGKAETEPRDSKRKCGILIRSTDDANCERIILESLHIRDIFAHESIKKDGKNPLSNMGFGILAQGAGLSAICIKDCRIERSGHTGIKIDGGRDGGERDYAEKIFIIGNRLIDIGGPGIQPGVCRDVIVRGNVVDGSGSSVDPRMHGRGSGIWPWTCTNVLIEKNKFMHARGKADSCGAHIDFNCRDVVIQYNLSIDNAGGFVEILGNCHNCAYRYNISINDGFRQKGRNGAHQNGKVLWTSGYVGSGQRRNGPYNCYIYNNTIYVREDIRSCFSILPTTEGLSVANNIFAIAGGTVSVAGDQEQDIVEERRKAGDVFFANNIYTDKKILPRGLRGMDSNPLYGDPDFLNPGEESAEGYIARNRSLIGNKGIELRALPGDETGLRIGLEVDKDFFGNPISGKPDIGAIEFKR